MSKFTDPDQATPLVKILYAGDSGTGKTGSLVSLVKAGYKLRILDFDSGLGILRNYILAECPELIENVEFVSCRDNYKTTPRGPKFKMPAKAMVEAGMYLDKWTDGTKPEEWGPEYILVIDSLTTAGKCAYNFAESTNPNYKDKKLWYNHAQEMLENIIAAITADSFNTNVIVISHIDRHEATDTSLAKTYVSAIGRALGPKLPRYFNTLVMAYSSGTGTRAKKEIRTTPTDGLDLKTEAPMRMSGAFPLETGMASLFEAIKKS